MCILTKKRNPNKIRSGMMSRGNKMTEIREDLNTTGRESTSASGAGISMVPLEDIIATTVRAIQIDRRTPTEPKFSEILKFIPMFTGTEDVEQWFLRVETVRQNFELKSSTLLLLVINKLDGYALTWFHSKAEYAGYDYDALKIAMENAFTIREDRIALMRVYEKRVWKRSEKFITYYHEKIVLGNKLGFTDDEQLKYMIEGLDNSALQAQAKLARFNSLTEFMVTINDLTDEERGAKKQPAATGSTVVRVGQPRNGQQRGDQGVRCFNCNEMGHMASSCPKPRRQRGSCFKCGRFGHLANECRSTARRQEADSTTNAISKTESKKICSAYTLDLEVNFVNGGSGETVKRVLSLFDTGSCISLIKSKFVSFEYLKNMEFGNFTGVNGSKVEIQGIVNAVVSFKDFSVGLSFYVVPDHTMSYDALLGRDFVERLDDLKVSIELNNLGLKFVKTPEVDVEVAEIMNIDLNNLEDSDCVSLGEQIEFEDARKFYDIFNKHYVAAVRPDEPGRKFVAHIL